jgi:hypothetical protein
MPTKANGRLADQVREVGRVTQLLAGVVPHRVASPTGLDDVWTRRRSTLPCCACLAAADASGYAQFPSTKRPRNARTVLWGRCEEAS